jgi:hypothetical protein
MTRLVLMLRTALLLSVLAIATLPMAACTLKLPQVENSKVENSKPEPLVLQPDPTRDAPVPLPCPPGRFSPIPPGRPLSSPQVSPRLRYRRCLFGTLWRFSPRLVPVSAWSRWQPESAPRLPR